MDPEQLRNLAKQFETWVMKAETERKEYDLNGWVHGFLSGQVAAYQTGAIILKSRAEAAEVHNGAK